MAKTTPPPPPPDVGATAEPLIRPFLDWFREQSKGKTADELSVVLHELVGKVKDTGKKGVIQLTITIEPLKGSEDALLVNDQIKVKSPEHDREASIFYADRTGNLSRKDPNQLEFSGLIEVPGGKTDDLVDPATGEITKQTGSNT